jgi:hypothetical protein
MKKWSLLGTCLLACSSPSTSTDGGTDASGSDAQADVAQANDGGDGGPTGCNGLANVGPVTPQTFVASDPVTGDGGVIGEGTYVCTAAVVYTGADGGSGPTGTTLQDTLQISDGGVYQRVLSIVNDAGADGSPMHQNGHYTLGGSSISITQTCPPGAQPFNSYDSSGTKFHVYAPAAGPGNPGLMFEYTKQ